jgi:hypothetical protein
MHAQQYRLYGKVTNAKMEPLSYVTVQVKGEQIGTRTDDKGNYEFKLEEGEYEILFSLLGYDKQIIKFIHEKNAKPQNVILQEGANSLNEVKIITFKKDKAEEIIRNVIQHKEKITSAVNTRKRNDA